MSVSGCPLCIHGGPVVPVSVSTNGYAGWWEFVCEGCQVKGPRAESPQEAQALWEAWAAKVNKMKNRAELQQLRKVLEVLDAQ